MNVENMTIKLKEAISAADRIATQHGNPTIEVEHLFVALLSQKEGVAAPLFDSLRIPKEQVLKEATTLIERLPKTYGGARGSISYALNDLFTASEKEMEKFKDEFLSAEHVLLAMVESKQVLGSY